MAARQGGIAQIVVPRDVLIARARARRGADTVWPQGSKLAYGLLERRLRIASRGRRRSAACGAGPFFGDTPSAWVDHDVIEDTLANYIR